MKGTIKEMIMYAKDISGLSRGMGLDGILKDEKWIAEPKVDGERLILVARDGNVKTYSRLGNEKKVPWLENLRFIKDVVLDGEIYLPGGKSNDVASLLANGQEGLRYMIFDILEYDGIDVTDLPLWMRRELVILVVNRLKCDRIEYPEWRTDKKGFYEEMVKKGEEGVMLKNSDGLYLKGKRSENWVKWKKWDTWDMVITSAKKKPGTKASDEQGLLILFYGCYVNGKLTELGSLGTAIKEEEKENWIGKVVELKGYCQFPTGAIRHPYLVRVRDDKSATDCVFQRR